MVPFRYHIVTLISVFLALAAGVLLGAGPLQKTIDRGETVNVDTKELEQQLQDASAVSGQYAEFVWGVAAEVLPSALQDQRVALVILPGAESSQAQPIVRAVEMAGGEVVAQVQLPEIWASADQATYRQTLAAAVSAHLRERPSESNPQAILAQGLVEVLTGEGPSGDLIEAMLTDSETTMVQPQDLGEQAANSIVIVGPGGQAVSETVQSGESELPLADARTLWVSMAQAALTAPGSSVAVGQADTDKDFVSVLRADSVRIATVDQGGTAMAGVNTALALADGTLGAYGQGIGAAQAVAPFQTR